MVLLFQRNRIYSIKCFLEPALPIISGQKSIYFIQLFFSCPQTYLTVCTCSYPGCCVLKDYPVVIPSREIDSVATAFVADVHSRMASVCGEPVRFACRALIPTVLLQPATVDQARHDGGNEGGGGERRGPYLNTKLAPVPQCIARGGNSSQLKKTQPMHTNITIQPPLSFHVGSSVVGQPNCTPAISEQQQQQQQTQKACTSRAPQLVPVTANYSYHCTEAYSGQSGSSHSGTELSTGPIVPIFRPKSHSSRARVTNGREQSTLPRVSIVPTFSSKRAGGKDQGSEIKAQRSHRLVSERLQDYSTQKQSGKTTISCSQTTSSISVVPGGGRHSTGGPPPAKRSHSIPPLSAKSSLRSTSQPHRPGPTPKSCTAVLSTVHPLTTVISQQQTVLQPSHKDQCRLISDNTDSRFSSTDQQVVPNISDPALQYLHDTNLSLSAPLDKPGEEDKPIQKATASEVQL